jgi:hypothetical protein
MRFKSALFIALIASALVLFPSCGGGSKTSESAPSPTPAPARAEAPPSAAQAPAGEAPQAELPPGHPPMEGGATLAGRANTAPPLTPEAAAKGMPAGHPSIDTTSPMNAIPAPPPGSGTGSSAILWTAPKGWIEEQPSSATRRAQYRVPGPGGDGECAVFYFGPGQGGGPMDNAQRWASQFKKADGSPAADQAKTWETEVGDRKVLNVEVTGTYTGGMTMGMAAPVEKPGYMLLGAVAEGPDANWFFKFTGPEKTVRAQRAAFDGMLKSLK